MRLFLQSSIRIIRHLLLIILVIIPINKFSTWKCNFKNNVALFIYCNKRYLIVLLKLKFIYEIALELVPSYHPKHPNFKHPPPPQTTLPPPPPYHHHHHSHHHPHPNYPDPHGFLHPEPLPYPHAHSYPHAHPPNSYPPPDIYGPAHYTTTPKPDEPPRSYFPSPSIPGMYKIISLRFQASKISFTVLVAVVI